jgi:acyl-coenzyme A thioesterase PaaI-like protein
MKPSSAVNTRPSADPHRLKATRASVHPRCVVCSPANPTGLRQEYALQPDGSVESVFAGNDLFEGYSGLLHGGVIAALLDGAMTNCLFARGVAALTAELTVRYREPISARGDITARAWLTESRGQLHLLRAELRQDGRVKAIALAKFFENHE